jgi:hypothetical protein
MPLLHTLRSLLPTALVAALPLAAVPCSLAQASLAQAAPAQTPEDPAALERCRAQLESDVPARIAHGAFDAGEARLASLAPLVATTLTRVVALPKSNEKPFVLRALLDALIRLDGRARPADLAALAGAYPLFSQALVLVGRAPSENVAFLERWYGETRNTHWVAVANLLASAAPAKACERLLPEARIEIQFVVHDADTYRGRSRSSTNGIGCGSMDAPDGFPPTVLYELEPASDRFRNVVAPGPRPIAYVREVHAEKSFGVGQTQKPVERVEYAIELLRWIAGDRATSSKLAHRITIDVPWTDGQRYVARVEAELQLRRKLWSQMLARLASLELVSPELARAAAPIQVEIDDQRAEPRVELPQVGAGR